MQGSLLRLLVELDSLETTLTKEIQAEKDRSARKRQLQHCRTLIRDMRARLSEAAEIMKEWLPPEKWK